MTLALFDPARHVGIGREGRPCLLRRRLSAGEVV